MKNNYSIQRKVLNKELVKFLQQYFILKKDVYTYLLSNEYISIFDEDMGTFKDAQVPNTYSVYSDLVAETLLIHLHNQMEKILNKELVLNYSYMRVYKNGDILNKHIDRFSCQYSTTLFIGGDNWPIYLKPNQESSPIKVELKEGDMLVYEGCKMEHWRESFTGTECIQVFLHYTDKNHPEAANNKFDGRPYLGLPAWYKKKN